MEEINKPILKSQEKNSQTGEGNNLRLENWNGGNKENKSQGNSGDGKTVSMNRRPQMQAQSMEYKRRKRESQALKVL